MFPLLQPLAYCLVQQDGSGGGSVQGGDAAGHGDVHQHIAVLTNQLAQTVTLVADDDGGRTGQISFVHGHGTFTGSAEDPDALFLQGLSSSCYCGASGGRVGQSLKSHNAHIPRPIVVCAID